MIVPRCVFLCAVFMGVFANTILVMITTLHTPKSPRSKGLRAPSFNLENWCGNRVCKAQGPSIVNEIMKTLLMLVEDPSSPRASPAHSPRENGIDKNRLLKKDASSSPASTASSGSSTSLKSKEMSLVGHKSHHLPI